MILKIKTIYPPQKKKTDNNFNKKRSKNKIAQWFEYKDAISNCTVEKISEKGTFLFRDWPSHLHLFDFSPVRAWSGLLTIHTCCSNSPTGHYFEEALFSPQETRLPNWLGWIYEHQYERAPYPYRWITINQVAPPEKESEWSSWKDWSDRSVPPLINGLKPKQRWGGLVQVGL